MRSSSQFLSAVAPKGRPWRIGGRRFTGPFLGPANIALFLAALLVLTLAGPPILRWAVLDAAFTGSREACQAVGGACWAYVSDKFAFFLFGFYPHAEQWRPAVAVALVAALIAASLLPRFWRPALALGWGLGLVVALALMTGFGPLPAVGTDKWGGLPVSLMVSCAGILGGFPLGVVLALGRRSGLPFIRWACVAAIEVVRGVPLISILFMVNVMVPLFLPREITPEKLSRALLAYGLAAGAYFAEAVRGGLQGVPRTQLEAAAALALGPWQVQRLIVLPQALRIAIPALANTVVSFIKETSLVMVLGLYDLLGTIQLAGRDPQWLTAGIEGYVFAGAFYLTACTAAGRYATWLERRGHHRQG